MNAINQDRLQNIVLAVLKDITQDWDFDLINGFGPDTRLIEDLAFESIDLVQFAVSLEQAVGRKGLPFEKLFMKDGDYVDDVSVAEIVQFLFREVGA
ncbi:MAG: hypothetical protein MUE49_07150 [Rhodospirillales bacterium]|jgi:acyl carrier protein|nr:hypothetical protein [Rhodospirillales bacterium]